MINYRGRLGSITPDICLEQFALLEPLAPRSFLFLIFFFISSPPNFPYPNIYPTKPNLLSISPIAFPELSTDQWQRYVCATKTYVSQLGSGVGAHPSVPPLRTPLVPMDPFLA